MGGAPKPKAETNVERNARMLAARKGDADMRALSQKDAYLRRSKRRAPVFGGPETGGMPTATGGGATKLGVQV